MTSLKIALVVILVVYAAMNTYMYASQRQLMYFPAVERVTPAQVGLTNVDEVTLQPASGLDLISWYGAARAGYPTVLFFHGNGGAVQHREYRFRDYMAAGYGLLIVGYPGYGGNAGEPSEAAFRDASLAAYDFLRGRGVTGENIVLYGQSLGSSIAIQLAAQVNAQRLILEAPMSSAADVAKTHYPFLLVDLLLQDTYQSIEHIDRINMPLLVLHGSDDRIIPIELGRKLFAKAVEPKRFIELEGAGHNNLRAHGIDTYAIEFIEASE